MVVVSFELMRTHVDICISTNKLEWNGYMDLNALYIFSHAFPTNLFVIQANVFFKPMCPDVT